jgi:hypothetical protein
MGSVGAFWTDGLYIYVFIFFGLQKSHVGKTDFFSKRLVYKKFLMLFQACFEIYIYIFNKFMRHISHDTDGFGQVSSLWCLKAKYVADFVL